MEDESNRHEPSIETEVSNHNSLSFAIEMNFNTVSPEDTLLYLKAEPQKLTKNGVNFILQIN